MLKADFHSHTAEDPFHPWITYTAKDLIKNMAKRGYDVLAITCHNKRVFTEDLKKYAKKQGLLLIPGMELRLQGKDILLIDLPETSLPRCCQWKISQWRFADGVNVEA